MSQYKVIASNLEGMPEGSIVSDQDLEGLNIEALIVGGHLASVASKPAKAPETKE